MIITLRFLLSNKVYFLFPLFLLIACQPPIQEVPTRPPRPPFKFMVRVQQQGSYEPIERVHVSLDIKGQMPIDALSDHEGVVILEVDPIQEGRVGHLLIDKEGYQPYTKNLTIKPDELPMLVLLDNENKSIARVDDQPPLPPPTTMPSPTIEAVQPETAVSATNTPILTKTTEPPTNTPIPTVTKTPSPSGEIVAQVTSTMGDTWIYAGPGDGNVKMGSMNINDTGIVLGKDKWDGWYKLRIGDTHEGWVDKNQLTLIQGNATQIPVIWPPSETNTGSPESGDSVRLPTASAGGQCAVVSLEFTEWPTKDFDDITVSWTNVPANATHLAFAVNGYKDNKEAPLIYATQVDVNEEYFIGSWKFEEREFSTGTTFTYILQVQREDGTTICATNGTFKQ